ncbi:hypothetical protein M409DRAFT_17947 [Zasmidium cellare ATCC 36951]|uniref:PHD-type domain-containing protein n=1 Tax=Zasmidium cellare ATCC 36951 TaxID=1080233 RepID=A0A6A6CZS8_ZASCE|nr:uncharacterized protein M409DRAFT_17947 [Zasmidium cellare ATCC 36951]KAF2171710.1 hypothetical protein M409DRAFT_17947 [Zasmidium cellare ATCC 36951]
MDRPEELGAMSTLIKSSQGPFDEDGDASNDLQDLDKNQQCFCICRGLDEGTMIGCDGGCDDWFHLRCVGIKKKEQDLIEKYVCPPCTELGNGETIWKSGVTRGTSSQIALSPLAANEAATKQYEETAKINRLLEKDANRRQAANGVSQQRKTKGARKTVHATRVGLLAGSRVGFKRKAPLKPVTNNRRPQMRRLSYDTAQLPSTPKSSATLPSRTKTFFQKQYHVDEDTSFFVDQNDQMADDKMSVGMTSEDLQKEEDAKALELELLERTYAYGLVRAAMMQSLFGNHTERA